MLKSSYPYYLASKPVAANQDLVVTDKYTGEVAARVALADEAVIDSAIAAATAAAVTVAAVAVAAVTTAFVAMKAARSAALSTCDRYTHGRCSCSLEHAGRVDGTLGPVARQGRL